METPIGTLWLPDGKTLPAIVDISPNGALYIRNELGETFVSMTREQVMEFNKVWIENELNLPHDKNGNSKRVQK